MDQKELKRYLNVIKRAVSLIEGMLEMDDDGLLEKLADQTVVEQVKAAPPVVQPEPVVQQPEPVVQEAPREDTSQKLLEARKGHVAQLMGIDCWPEAVRGDIASREPTKEDQLKRAKSVLDTMLTVSASEKTFLDFGCGDGWITQETASRGIVEAVGYDIEESEDWVNQDGVSFTTNWEDIKHNHFDFVMLYDVLDHAHDPVDVMNKVKSALKPDGHIYIRCHPWTAKHASHLYKKGLNKAFVHLFLKWEEIKEIIGEEPMFVRPEVNPIEAYHWWFNDFKIVKERVIKEPISDFFHVPAFKELLSNEQGIPMGKEFDDFMERMELQFVDYELVLP